MRDQYIAEVAANHRTAGRLHVAFVFEQLWIALGLDDGDENGNGLFIRTVQDQTARVSFDMGRY